MPQNNSPMLSIQSVGFFYYVRKGYLRRKKVEAIKDISFELHRGEALGVVGVNGAGKSTLLKLMAGIYAPDRGLIETFGHTVSLLSLQAGFTPYLSGRDNVLLSGLTLGLKKIDILERMDEIEAFADIGEYFHLPVSSYSSGMKARLGFSIGFEIDPDVLLIDEVFGVGDEAFRDKSSKKMRAKVRSNKSVVMVAHNDMLIRNLCDRAILLDGGKVVRAGECDDVMDYYRDNYLKKIRT